MPNINSFQVIASNAKKFINECAPKEFEDHNLTFIGQQVTISTIEIAGDDNMNFTYRLVFDDGLSKIVKQSSPYYATFSVIIAPQERILSEGIYYQLLEEDSYLSKHSDDLLGIGRDKKIAYISDLEQATDFEFLYSQQKKLDPKICEKIILYMAKPHSLAIPKETNFENLKMRELNHAYIFDLAFKSGERPIDLDLITDGLAKTVDFLMNDQELKTAAEKLGKLYFESTRTLIHGDYYPISWIETNKGLFVIDPEFGFLGLPEIDVGKVKLLKVFHFSMISVMIFLSGLTYYLANRR